MSRVLSDLSQLTKAMIKSSEAQPKPAPKVVNQEDARRAEILRYVLAANQSAGELERRRAELRQILKDGEPQCKIKRSDFGFKWPDNAAQSPRVGE